MSMRLGLILVSTFALAACNGGKGQTNIELMQDMMDQINVKAQDWDADRPGMRANMVPPANTVPRGFTPYKYRGKPLDADAKLVNPLANDFSPQVIELGKAKYDVYCAVCHGPTGQGDGTVAPKMLVKPKNLVEAGANSRSYKDGRIFHVITDGQGLMGYYDTQITDEKARWAVVNYVRTLQRQANSK
ncbi:MAG: cytochrome c [Bdellovibrionales bacterium]